MMYSLLIVEDDRGLQSLFEYMLSKTFLIKGIASNGDEAVKMYEAFVEKPDIVIMDHRMPFKDGVVAMKEILQINRDAKIIFASADADVKEIVMQSGAVGFMEKPFAIDELIKKIMNVLDYEGLKI